MDAVAGMYPASVTIIDSQEFFPRRHTWREKSRKS
jgi:hypothetical protein